ncbi:MAG: polysaccharide deacetylase family protein [Saprospiraceae bacterium]
MKYILLSFDLEEFDIPLEYGQQIDLKEQLQVSHRGLERLIPALTDQGIECTFFTTATYAQAHAEEIKNLSAMHEIASHANTHTGFETNDYSKSKQYLEHIIQKPVYGFRMPRLATVDIDEIKKAGYQYDSSIHPTWIPGRYNHRHLPENIFSDHGILRVPCSVSPSPIRFPLFWLSFKNLPLNSYRYFLNQSLTKNGYACLYFHPWEYADIGSFKLPGIIKSVHGMKLIDKLAHFIKLYKQKGIQFISIKEYLDLMPYKD